MPSPSQMQFFSSLWLAHQPFGTVCSRKFSAPEGGQDFSSRSKTSTVQKLRGDWSSLAGGSPDREKAAEKCCGRRTEQNLCPGKGEFWEGSW